MSLVVAIIVRTDVALLARMLSIMDVMLGSIKVAKSHPGQVQMSACGECRASCFLKSAILANVSLQPAAAEQV